jgi:hypothetical protein
MKLIHIVCGWQSRFQVICVIEQELQRTSNVAELRGTLSEDQEYGTRQAYQQIRAQTKYIKHGIIIPNKNTANIMRAWHKCPARSSERCGGPVPKRHSVIELWTWRQEHEINTFSLRMTKAYFRELASTFLFMFSKPCFFISKFKFQFKGRIWIPGM